MIRGIGGETPSNWVFSIDNQADPSPNFEEVVFLKTHNEQYIKHS